VTRHALLLCAVVGLVVTAGCVGGDTATPTPTDVQTPTPTPSYPVEVVTPSPTLGTPTSTPTPTSTLTPTPTPTPTPSPTPTPTPTPDVETVAVGEWAETTHSNTTVRIRVQYTRVKETIETRDGGTERAADDARFVVAKVDIASRPGDRVEVGRSQWALVDWTGERHDPDSVTGEMENPFPAEEVLHNDHAEGRIVWEVEHYEDREFEVEPYGGQSGGTVRIVDDT